LLSPDNEFSKSGTKSGIKYSESFKKYKEMLTEDRNSSMLKRIFAEFNTSLFGTAPPRSDDFVPDDGDYDSELEQFRNELRADSPTVIGIANSGGTRTPPPSSPPTSPVQPDHHVLISVTSHLSHTIAMSPQVSNIMNNSIVLPSGREDNEDPPSPLKVSRPTAKKKGGKSSKSTTETTTSDVNAGTTSSTKQKRTRKEKATPVEPPTGRVLRERT